MTIRSKFKVTEISQTEYGTALRARTVYGDSPENKAFFEASPNGSFEVTGTKPGIFAGLKPGDEFYLDVVPVIK